MAKLKEPSMNGGTGNCYSCAGLNIITASEGQVPNQGSQIRERRFQWAQAVPSRGPFLRESHGDRLGFHCSAGLMTVLIRTPIELDRVQEEAYSLLVARGTVLGVTSISAVSISHMYNSVFL